MIEIAFGVVLATALTLLLLNAVKKAMFPGTPKPVRLTQRGR